MPLSSAYGSVPARTGNKAFESGKRIACMEKAVEILKRGSFMEDYAEVKPFRKRFINSQDESESS